MSSSGHSWWSHPGASRIEKSFPFLGVWSHSGDPEKMLGIYLFSRCIYIYQIYLSIWIYLFSWGSIWFWSWWWKWWCTLNLQDAPSASRWRSWRVWTWTSLPVPRKAAGFLGMFLVDGDLQKMDIWVTDHQGYPLVNIQKTMVNHHAINGFYGHFQ